MARLGRFDTALQMFVEQPIQLSDIDVNRLRFLRWDMERRPGSDGVVCGPSSGEIVDFLAEKAAREDEAVTVAA